MSQKKAKQPDKLGGPEYVNRNCWLVETLEYPAVKRCQYCELNFRGCLFSQYLAVSVAAALLIFTAAFFIEGHVSHVLIVSVLAMIMTYGYFFSESTEKIIEVNFAEKQAKKALEELNEELEDRVEQRTKALKKAYQELKVLDEAKTEFISIASHQLRTPLGAMRGYLSMLIQGDFGKLPPKAEEAAQEVYQASLRLLKLSNDLLNVSRIESGKCGLNYEEVDVGQFISSIVEELRVEFDGKKLDLEIKIGKGVKSAEFDSEKLRQVFLNIMDNALKYTEKGKVTVEAENSSADCLLIKVKDTGAGLDKDDINKLFRSFARGRAGSSLHSAGTGLGLYVAHKFVEQHKGRLWAESLGRDKGSTFFVELPLKKP